MALQMPFVAGLKNLLGSDGNAGDSNAFVVLLRIHMDLLGVVFRAAAGAFFAKADNAGMTSVLEKLFRLVRVLVFSRTPVSRIV